MARSEIYLLLGAHNFAYTTVISAICQEKCVPLTVDYKILKKSVE